MKKSQFAGFLLTLLFGPLGLFYSSVPAALGFVVAVIAIGAMTGGVGAILIWPIVIIVSFFTVSSYNSKIEIEEKRHKELVEATKIAQRLDQ